MRENAGPSIAVAALAAFGYVIWAWLLAVLVWAAVTIYTIVKWIGAPNDHPSATTLLVVIVGIVTFWPLSISLAFYAIGRSIRRNTEREEPALSADAANA